MRYNSVGRGRNPSPYLFIDPYYGLKRITRRYPATGVFESFMGAACYPEAIFDANARKKKGK